MFDVCFRILPRLLFWSRLTPILVLLVAGAFMLVRYFDPEPSQTNVEQAFNGFKWNSASTLVAAVHGARDIRKEGCVPVAEAETAGYLCTLSCTPNRSTGAPVEGHEGALVVPRGGWAVGSAGLEPGCQTRCHPSSTNASRDTSSGGCWGTQLRQCSWPSCWLRLYRAWPGVTPGMHERATPWVSRHPSPRAIAMWMTFQRASQAVRTH